MADRGFTIADVLDARGVTLNIPPTKVNDQLSASELITTRKIAALRIHVERAIGKIKNFKILDGIPNSMNGIVDQIFFVCCMLCNFQHLFKRCLSFVLIIINLIIIRDQCIPSTDKINVSYQ